MKKTGVLFILIFLCAVAMAQEETVPYDSSYYIRYRNKLVVTPFIDKPIRQFNVHADNKKFAYKTNVPARMGLYAGYDFLSLSASFGIGALDPDYNKNKGKTKTFNLQSTITGRKLLLDFLIQNNKGFYIPNSNRDQLLNTNGYYIRPDIQSNLFAVNGQYVLNGKRFSTRPPYRYDTWQKKSSGSFLLGFDILFGKTRGDSALIPKAYNNSLSPVYKVGFFSLGPNVGYGHTFVMGKYFYTTLIGTVNAGLSTIKEYTDTDTYRTWKFSPNFNGRIAIGYNKENTQVALSYFTDNTLFRYDAGNRYFVTNSNIRLSYTKRINPGKTIPRIVNTVGKILRTVGLGFILP